MKAYLLFIILNSGNMHSMEFATYNDCAQAQQELKTILTQHQGTAQCLAKGSLIEDGIDKTKGAIGTWLNEQAKKYNEAQ